jgi:cobalt/nickel transport system permease protein
MTLAFVLPPCPDSPLSRLDPRWRLAALALAGLAVTLLQSLPATLCGLGGALLLVCLARLPLRWVGERLAAVMVVLLLFVVPLPFLLGDEAPIWSWGWLQVSWTGVRLALLLSAKGLALLSLALVVLGTAPLEVNLKAAHALRVPGLLVHLALLAFRYLFVLGEELGRLRVAVRVRGYRNRMSRHCYRTIGHLAGTLLVRGDERAERVGQAMRCRGFTGELRTLTSFRTRPLDIAASTGIVLVSTLLYLGDWLLWARS